MVDDEDRTPLAADVERRFSCDCEGCIRRRFLGSLLYRIYTVIPWVVRAHIAVAAALVASGYIWAVWPLLASIFFLGAGRARATIAELIQVPNKTTFEAWEKRYGDLPLPVSIEVEKLRYGLQRDDAP